MNAPAHLHQFHARSNPMAPKRSAPPAEPLDLIQLPASERGLAPDQVERFDKARAELLSPRLNLNDRQKDDRARVMSTVEHSARRAAVAAEIDRGLLETLDLAEARGEDVQRTGAIRVNSHDGLKSMFEGQKLTREQYEDGRYFREGWEARSGDMGSQLGNEGGGGAHNNDLYVFNRRLRAEKLAWLGKVELAVAVRCKDDPNALKMLRRVAGDGMALRVFGGGATFYRNLKALVRALDVAGTIERPKGSGRS